MRLKHFGIIAQRISRMDHQFQMEGAKKSRMMDFYV